MIGCPRRTFYGDYSRLVFLQAFKNIVIYLPRKCSSRNASLVKSSIRSWSSLCHSSVHSTGLSIFTSSLLHEIFTGLFVMIRPKKSNKSSCLRQVLRCLQRKYFAGVFQFWLLGWHFMSQGRQGGGNGQIIFELTVIVCFSFFIRFWSLLPVTTYSKISSF